MERNYYSLVAGLRDYSFDTDAKGFDAVAIRDEICEGLHEKDRDYLRDFYLFYDIANLISLRSGKEAFNELGNFSREELKQASDDPEMFPDFLAEVVAAYNIKAREERYADLSDPYDGEPSFSRALWARYYEHCERSGCEFLRKWYGFDQEVRNIGAAYTARKKGREIAGELVGTSDVAYQLSRSSAADFGLRGEIDYLERLVQILDTPDMLEKERRLDQLRWDKAEEFTELDYFNLDKILAYLVKVNIIYRWMSLDEETGRRMFRKLIGEMTGTGILDSALVTMHNRWNKSE